MIKTVYNMRVYHGELSTKVYTMKKEACEKNESRELNSSYITE